MAEKTKKATFNLHTEVIEALNEAVERGGSPSKNALVEQALIKELNELKRKARQERWREAAKDPLLLKDIEDIDAEFKTADEETARRIG